MNDYANFYRQIAELERQAERGNRRQRRSGAAWERTPEANAPQEVPRFSPQEVQRLERETEIENARQRARREYSPLPDEAGPLVPLTAMVGDLVQAPSDALLAREGDPRAQRRLGERDERWRRGAERAGQDILAEGHGGQLMQFFSDLPEQMDEAEQARLEAGGRDTPLDRVGSALGGLWTGMAAAPREHRGEVAAQDVIRTQNRSDAEDAMLRGDDVGANRAARSGQMAEEAGDVAAGEDFWYNAPWAAEFAPGVGLVDLAASAGRFGARQGLRAAGQEVPEALARPNRLSETQAVGPATENARGWRNNAALGGAAYLGADAIDGELGDDYIAPAMLGGAAMIAGREAGLVRGIDSAIPEEIQHLMRQGEIGPDGARNYTPRPRQRLTVDPQGRVAMDYEGSFNSGADGSTAETFSVIRGAREALDDDIATTRRSEYSWTPNDERLASIYRGTLGRSAPDGYAFSETPQGEMRLRRDGAEFEPDPLEAVPVPEGAPFGFEGAPGAGRIIDAEATPVPARTFEAAIRDPETGRVYRGEDHQQAIDSAPDDAVRARLQAAYDATDEDPSIIGFQVDGQFMGREEGLQALRSQRRQVRIGEQVNADGSVAPLSEIDWDSPNTRLDADYQEADSLAGMPTGPADRRLGAALAVGGGGGALIGSALEGEAQADDGSGSEGVPMLPVLGAGAGAATLAALSRGRLADDFADSVGMSGGRGARRLGAETDLPSDVNPGRSENASGTGGQRRYRSRNDERNARIVALAEELGTYDNRGTGGAGMRRENSTDAIAAQLRSEGYGDVSRSTVLGVLKRERDRLSGPTLVGAVDPDVAAAERLGMSVERYRSLSARRRNEAIAAIGVTGTGGALLLGDEAQAQGFDPNGQWIGQEQRRDVGGRTEIRQRFRDSQGRIFEGVRYQDHATGAISAPQMTPIDAIGEPDLTQTYDPTEVPLRPEEVERIQAMRDAEARRLGQTPEHRESRSPEEREPTTPSWAMAAPLVAGVLGGRLGRRLSEEAGRPLAGETAGALVAGGVTGGGVGLFTEAQDSGDLATFGTVLGAGGRGGYRLGQEGVRRSAEALADFRPPAPRRVRGQPLPYVGDEAVAPMSEPGALRPPPARQPDRVSGSLDEGDLTREMSGRAIEEGRRRLRSTPVTMEERLNVPPGERGSLEGRLGTLGAEPLRELARREGLPTEGTVRDLARRLADAARADPARVQRYRDVFQALGVSGVIIGGASQLLPQDAQAGAADGASLPNWADDAGVGAGAVGLALMGRAALPQALERLPLNNARLGQLSRVSQVPLDLPQTYLSGERSRLGRAAFRNTSPAEAGAASPTVAEQVSAGVATGALGGTGAAMLIDPYVESPQERLSRFDREVMPYAELRQQAMDLFMRGVSSREVRRYDPELADEVLALEQGGSEGARRLGVRSEAAPAQ